MCICAQIEGKKAFVSGWNRIIYWLNKIKINYPIIIWFGSKSQELNFEL